MSVVQDLTNKCLQQLLVRVQNNANRVKACKYYYYYWSDTDWDHLPQFVKQYAKNKIYVVEDTISWNEKKSYQTHDKYLIDSSTSISSKSSSSYNHYSSYSTGERNTKENVETNYRYGTQTNTHYVTETQTKKVRIYYILLNQLGKDNYNRVRNLFNERYAIENRYITPAHSKEFNKFSFVKDFLLNIPPLNLRCFYKLGASYVFCLITNIIYMINSLLCILAATSIEIPFPNALSFILLISAFALPIIGFIFFSFNDAVESGGWVRAHYACLLISIISIIIGAVFFGHIFGAGLFGYIFILPSFIYRLVCGIKAIVERLKEGGSKAKEKINQYNASEKEREKNDYKKLWEDLRRFDESHPNYKSEMEKAYSFFI